MTKLLTQEVFKGIEPKFKWAASDRDGNVYAYGKKPVRRDSIWSAKGIEYIYVATTALSEADAANWQDSLIEREQADAVFAPGADTPQYPEPPIPVPLPEPLAPIGSCPSAQFWDRNTPPEPVAPGPTNFERKAKAEKKAKRKADAKAYNELVGKVRTLLASEVISYDVFRHLTGIDS